jgi:hypothetical protein
LPRAPLRSARDKLCGNHNQSLSYLLVHNSGAGQGQLFADDNEFVYSLEILTHADFNGDGVGDVVVMGCILGEA